MESVETKTTRGNHFEEGQAIIEYILLLSIILSLSGLMISGIHSTRDKMWKRFLCEISAACPTCKATDSAKAALPKAKVQCKQ